MSAEHPVPQEAVETNEQERKEKFQSSLAELKKFDEMLYPGVVAFVDSLGDRTQLSPEEQQQAKALMDSVLNLNILNTAFFNNYLKDKQSPIGAVIVHDLSNSVTAMLGFIQLYKEGEDVGLEALLEIKNSYPTFSLIVQDVLLKYLESDQNFTDDPRPMNIALFKQAVNRGLNDKSAAQGRLAKLLTGQLNSSSQYKKFFNMDIPLADGEEIVCEPAVVFNGINNVVNNSIKLQVDANAINVDVRREGDEL
ncbi:MAG: hypothetical protein NT034_02310, partial [Candidatus Magasanikbacteria bacterium]|nr:hypothetical protein [Candidatus Magasanikbacteria bacterium]